MAGEHSAQRKAPPASGSGHNSGKKEEPRRSVFPSVVLDTEEDGVFCVDTEDCRAKARELRQQARTANDPTNRAHLLMMAAQYYWFAGWIEAQAHTPEQP
jgi:hypothetical protein